jgi:hypothetical protein
MGVTFDMAISQHLSKEDMRESQFPEHHRHRRNQLQLALISFVTARTVALLPFTAQNVKERRVVPGPWIERRQP